MGECASRGIAITFLSRSGRFSARVVGQSRGNVVLRKTQYRVSDDLKRVRLLHVTSSLERSLMQDLSQAHAARSFT